MSESTEAVRLLTLYAKRNCDPSDEFTWKQLFNDAEDLSTDDEKFHKLEKIWGKFSGIVHVSEQINNELSGSVLELLDVFRKTFPKVYPPSFCKIVKYLHDYVFLYESITDEILNKLCLLCESLWRNNAPWKREICVNSSFYLTLKLSLEPSKMYLKRLHSIRHCFALFDFDDPDSENLKQLLLEIFSRVSIIKEDVGRKFLAYIFSVFPKFSEVLHSAMKAKLPKLSKDHARLYGSVYYEAWKILLKSNSDFLNGFEINFIQDLMHAGIHLADSQTLDLLHELLFAFHDSGINSENMAAQFSEMLARLYEPILWRNLKVPNADVRLNGTKIFLNLFPMKNLLSSNSDNEHFLQTQITELFTLLTDIDQRIRETCVERSFKILFEKYSILPLDFVGDLLACLINDLAHDQSQGASSIRAAVITGIQTCLDSEVEDLKEIMMTFVCKLSFMIHDKSERVRLAVLDLILNIQDQKKVRFYDYFDVDQLLYRLSQDKSPKCKAKLCSILVNSYFPQKKSIHEQTERVCSLLEVDFTAAVSLMLNAAKQISIDAVIKVFVYFVRWIVLSIRNEQNASDMEVKSKKKTGKNKSRKLAEIDNDFQAIPCDLKQAAAFVCVVWPQLQDFIQSKPEIKDQVTEFILESDILKEIESLDDSKSFFWYLLSSFKASFIRKFCNKARGEIDDCPSEGAKKHTDFLNHITAKIAFFFASDSHYQYFETQTNSILDAWHNVVLSRNDCAELVRKASFALKSQSLILEHPPWREKYIDCLSSDMNLYESTLKPIQYLTKVLKVSGEIPHILVDFVVDSVSNIFRVCMHLNISMKKRDAVQYPLDIPPQCKEILDIMCSLEIHPEDSLNVFEEEVRKSKRKCEKTPESNSSMEHLIRLVILECLKLCCDASTIGYYSHDFIQMTLQTLKNSFSERDSYDQDNSSINLTTYQMDILKSSYKLCYQLSEMQIEGESLKSLASGVREAALEQTKVDPFSKGYFKKLSSQLNSS